MQCSVCVGSALDAVCEPALYGQMLCVGEERPLLVEMWPRVVFLHQLLEISPVALKKCLSDKSH